jgi:hypothetical protein
MSTLLVVAGMAEGPYGHGPAGAVVRNVTAGPDQVRGPCPRANITRAAWLISGLYQRRRVSESRSLSEDEIEAVDKIAKTRANLTRNLS